jgi:prolipoprotein diacylglyceryl transferase
MDYFVWSTSPIAFSLGPITVYWYGILFASAILAGLQFMKWVYKQEGKDEEILESMFLYITIGIVVGARLGHVLFYDPSYYFANPAKILAVWEGGLASHGGGIGVIIALYIFAKKHKLNYIWLLDRVAIPTALFGFFVRMGNFMNSEIIGKPTEVSWAVIFSRVDMLPRHPAQLYESFSYLAIFILLTLVYKYKRDSIQNGFIFGLFLTLLFSVRILVEFVKVKQADYDTSFLMMSTGQALSLPFIVIGLGFIFWSLKK